MRDFLNDALDHRDDGYGRAQRNQKRELPKRFYSRAGWSQRAEGDFIVTLDGRETRTPSRVPVRVPNAAVAEAMAREWEAQGEEIDPDLMPHVRLVNSAMEAGEAARADLLGEVVEYCGNDLLLYRAESPRELVAIQEDKWDGALVVLARHFAIRFEPTVGIIFKAQADETLQRLEASVAEADLLTAAALASITTLTGSGLLAVALHERLLDPDAVWTAAHVDEDYQISLWGEDFEASERRRKRRVEFDAAVDMLTWCAKPSR